MMNVLVCLRLDEWREVDQNWGEVDESLQLVVARGDDEWPFQDEGSQVILWRRRVEEDNGVGQRIDYENEQENRLWRSDSNCSTGMSLWHTRHNAHRPSSLSLPMPYLDRQIDRCKTVPSRSTKVKKEKQRLIGKWTGDVRQSGRAARPSRSGASQAEIVVDKSRYAGGNLIENKAS